jgi:hypothetical protein
LTAFQDARLAATRNVILVTLDGVRVEEIFAGLDLAVLQSTIEKGAVEETATYRAYWAATPAERRERLMPFFWRTLMTRHGSIAGNTAKGSAVTVANRHRFSYPGYAEILTGQAHDDVINSNEARRIPFPTVLEAMKHGLGVSSDRIAAFASWGTFDAIVEHQAGAITSNAGIEDYESDDPQLRLLNQLQRELTTPWESVRHDGLTFRLALAHLAAHRPRALYIALDETDDWAHDGRYDRVLTTLAQIDRYLQQLWEFVESQPDFRDKTTLIVTVDHGRGRTPQDWRTHGAKVEGAQDIWIAIVDPDSRRRGEWINAPALRQNQIAATLARAVGLDWGLLSPGSGPSIPLMP